MQQILNDAHALAQASLTPCSDNSTPLYSLYFKQGFPSNNIAVVISYECCTGKAVE